MILIVDDKPDNIFSLKSLLTLHKFDVDTAGSGEEALKKILGNSYSLIILDVQMPMCNGIDAAYAIQQHDPDLAIVLMTGLDPSNVIEAVGAAGLDFLGERRPSDYGIPNSAQRVVNFILSTYRRHESWSGLRSSEENR